MRIGYMVPEFPGQTHIFFWREREALQEVGVDTSIISTVRPPQGVISHTWAKSAEQEATYLFPFSVQDGVLAIQTILQAGPGGWWKCMRAIAQAEGVTPIQRLRLVALIPIAAKLVRLSKTQGWHHIHVHSCATSADIAMFASFLSTLTYSLTQHGPAFDTYGPNQGQKWQYATFGTLVSEMLLEEARARIPDSLPEQISVVTMGVNLEEIDRRQPYQPWLEHSPCRIFSTGRLNVVKAHGDLIQATKLLVQKGYDVRLQIAGEDEQGGAGYHKHLNQLIQDLDLNNHVELLGAVSEERIREGLEQAHLFALASLNEGTSVAIMEAMAMSMPVVVTAVGGTPKLVQDGVNGLLVEPENPGAIANRIISVLLDPELAVELGKAARQTIAAKYHHRRSAEVLAHFLKLLPPEPQNSLQ
ncbi:MAG: exopolysaccharide biosynthesis GT4 family glycosyltransferase EpsE [Leptolyngbyaceae cyanobacterium bins.302]|nr:exopolysaccharide biosynthesis GT4 family glycosyltransferase EpsE [Leptolyngbyaceae cyanobacterium bins.302]